MVITRAEGAESASLLGPKAPSLGFGSASFCFSSCRVCLRIVMMQDQFELVPNPAFLKQDDGGTRYFITCQLFFIKVKRV